MRRNTDVCVIVYLPDENEISKSKWFYPVDGSKPKVDHCS
jgi:hypothetical protein